MKLWKASAKRIKWNSTPIATLLFLLVAASILFGLALLVRSVAKNSLQEDPRQARHNAVTTVSPEPPVASPDPALRVLAVRTPPVSPTPTPGVTITPTPPATPVMTNTPSPSPTLLPLMTAPPMRDDGVSLLFIAMDARSQPDWIAAVRIAGDACDILSIPRNTVRDHKTRLLDAGSAKTCAAMLKYIWPVQYPVTVSVSLAGLPEFIDALSGVAMDGKTIDGAAAAEYLSTGPSDELLRIYRQQTFMRAYLCKLQSVSILSLLKSRFTLEQYMESNLGLAASLQLLEQVRHIDVNAVSFHTLPVDSISVAGERCYAPDVARINQMAPAYAQSVETE